MSEQAPLSTATGAPRLPPPASRFWAAAIDLSFVLALSGVTAAGATLVAEDVPVVWLVVIGALVHGYLHGVTTWLSGGQTVGKAVFGLAVRDVDASPTDQSWRSAARLVLRYSVGYLLTDLFLVGTLWSLRDARRRCPHDVLFRTQVVALESSLDLSWRDRLAGLRALADDRAAGMQLVTERWKPLMGLIRWSSSAVVSVLTLVVQAAARLGVLDAALERAAQALAGSPPATTAGSGTAAGSTAGTAWVTGTTVIAGGLTLAAITAGTGPVPTEFAYGGISYATGNAAVEAHPPGIDPAGPDPDPGTDHVLLDVSVLNDTGVPTEAVRYGRMDVAGSFGLSLSGGDPVRAEALIDGDGRVQTVWRLSGVPHQDLQLAFPVGSGQDLRDPVLHLQINEMSELAVPLDGEPYEHTVEDVEVLNPTWSGEYQFGQASFEVVEATASLEFGTDEDTGELLPALHSGYQRRAESGFVLLRLRTTVQSEQDPSAMVGGRQNLGRHYTVADGVEYPGVDDFGIDPLPVSGDDPVTYNVVVPVPIDATSVAIAYAPGHSNPPAYLAEVDTSFLGSFRE